MSEIATVKAKALKSAKWMFLTSILSVPCSCATSVILGQIAPETLGVYSAVNVFIASLTTFVCMGGAIVLSNFFPKMETDVEKTQLLRTYVFDTAIMYAVFVIVIMSFPKLNIILLGGLRGVEKIIALFMVAPIFITMTIISYLLIALLEARISNIMTKLYIVFLSVVLFVIYMIDKSFLENHLPLIIFLCLIVSNLIAIIVGVRFIKKQGILCKVGGFYAPKGFYTFSVITFFQALFSYLYKNVDKMFLLSLKDLGQLGYYQAILSILTVVEFVPSLLGNITIPFFSNVIKAGEKDEIASTYERIEKYMLFFLVSCVVFIITFSDIILNMFGKGYVDYKYILIILLVAKCIASLGFTNTPMMIVLEKNWVRLSNSVLQIVIQFTITIFTLDSLGMLGVVLGRVIGVCVAQIIPQLTIKYRSNYNIKITRAYFAGILCALTVGVFQVCCDFDLIFSICIALVCWIGFILLGGFQKKDFKSMLNMLLKRDKIKGA